MVTPSPKATDIQAAQGSGKGIYIAGQSLFERDGVPRPEVSPIDLKLAWLTILSRVSVNKHHKITREQLSVRAHMTRVLRRLQEAEFVEFVHLFNASEGKPVLVVTFIALLELAKETLIEITQAEAFAPIYVRLAYQPA